MEPNKIEKHMQKVLKERKISPSNAAWESVSQELDLGKKPNNKKFYRYAIAASVIILISFSLFFYTKKDVDSINSIVIEQTNKQNIEGEQDVNEIGKVKKSPNLVVVPNGKLKKIPKEKTKPKARIDYTEPVEEEFIVYKAPLLDRKDSFVISEAVLDTKVAAIVEKTEFLKARNYEVTDAEIDSLIREAQLEILTNKLFKNKGRVDAFALLNEVEGELDTSFREQIFKSLKNKFLKVKTAVADRNN